MAKKDEKGLLYWLGAIPGWLLTIIAIVLIIIPLYHPFGLPVPVTQPTRDFYDTLVSLPDGSVILFAQQASTFSWPDLKDALFAACKYIFKRDFKVVFFTILPEADPMITTLLSTVVPENYGKVYGQDYVSLGYIAGLESGVAHLSDNMHTAVSVDSKGTPVSEIPMMQAIHDGNDVDLLILFAGGVTDHEAYIRQFVVRYNTPMIEGITSGSMIGVVPYHPHQIHGYVAGISGGAGLELLVGEPGGALKGTDIKNLNLLAGVIIIILGNISYYGTKYLRKEEVKES